MEQLSRDLQQQEQPPPPLKCPRCNSNDTKFRYYNNKKTTQPRYSCRTCRRQWTAGGNIRNIPIGVEAMVPQNFHTTMVQPPTNHPPPAPAFPQRAGYFNGDIPCLNVIQSFIHPELINQHVNVGNQFSSGGDSLSIPQEWNIPPMASQQTFHQQIPRYFESQQTYRQANIGSPSHLHNNTFVQPAYPMNSMTRGGVSTSNTSLRNNFRGNTADEEIDTNSVNVDEWLNLSDDSS